MKVSAVAFYMLFFYISSLFSLCDLTLSNILRSHAFEITSALSKLLKVTWLIVHYTAHHTVELISKRGSFKCQGETFI